MASDILCTVLSLAMKVKDAYDGVQGNKDQCKLLNDHVQNVARSLKTLPPKTQKKTEIKEVLTSLVETLRSATSLIEGFTQKHWIKKYFSHASTAAKFEELFKELDRVLAVCGFAFQVSRRKRGGVAVWEEFRVTCVLPAKYWARYVSFSKRK